MRLHVSYSDKHYHPERPRTERFNYTAGQTAYHLWRCLRERYEHVTYGDTVPREDIDLLWIQREHAGFPNVARIAYLQAGANAIAINRAIREAQKLPWLNGACLRGKPRDQKSIKSLFASYQTIARSDAVLLKGNRCTLAGYAKYYPRELHRFALMNNAVLPGVYESRGDVRPFNTFVYPASSFCLRKGSHLVSAAWKMFSKQHDGAKLLLLGRPDDYDFDKDFLGCSGVENLGPFEAGSAHYIAALNRAKWVIFPSLAEGQAGTLLEAMSCGCIPIASRESGIDADQYGGYAVAPNTAENLSLLMTQAIGNAASDASESLLRVTTLHRWNHFQDLVIGISEQLLGGPKAVRIATPIILARFIAALFRGYT